MARGIAKSESKQGQEPSRATSLDTAAHLVDETASSVRENAATQNQFELERLVGLLFNRDGNINPSTVAQAFKTDFFAAFIEAAAKKITGKKNKFEELKKIVINILENQQSAKVLDIEEIISMFKLANNPELVPLITEVCWCYWTRSYKKLQREIEPLAENYTKYLSIKSINPNFNISHPSEELMGRYRSPVGAGSASDQLKSKQSSFGAMQNEQDKEIYNFILQIEDAKKMFENFFIAASMAINVVGTKSVLDGMRAKLLDNKRNDISIFDAIALYTAPFDLNYTQNLVLICQGIDLLIDSPTIENDLYRMSGEWSEKLRVHMNRLAALIDQRKYIDTTSGELSKLHIAVNDRDHKLQANFDENDRLTSLFAYCIPAEVINGMNDIEQAYLAIRDAKLFTYVAASDSSCTYIRITDHDGNCWYFLWPSGTNTDLLHKDSFRRMFEDNLEAILELFSKDDAEAIDQFIDMLATSIKYDDIDELEQKIAEIKSGLFNLGSRGRAHRYSSKKTGDKEFYQSGIREIGFRFDGRRQQYLMRLTLMNKRVFLVLLDKDLNIIKPKGLTAKSEDWLTQIVVSYLHDLRTSGKKYNYDLNGSVDADSLDMFDKSPIKNRGVRDSDMLALLPLGHYPARQFEHAGEGINRIVLDRYGFELLEINKHFVVYQQLSEAEQKAYLEKLELENDASEIMVSYIKTMWERVQKRRSDSAEFINLDNRDNDDIRQENQERKSQSVQDRINAVLRNSLLGLTRDQLISQQIYLINYVSEPNTDDTAEADLSNSAPMRVVDLSSVSQELAAELEENA